MKGIENFLLVLNEHWTSILVILGFVISAIQETKIYLSKSDDEKIEIAKLQIRETMLKMVTDVELDFDSWVKAGSIKRSKVIDKIFEKYPILSKVADQDEIVCWIDDEIKKSLSTLRNVITENDNKKNT